jgi:D-amino peptidase
MIEEAASTALRDLTAVAPYDPGSPCTIEVELGQTDHAEGYRQQRMVEVVDGRTVRSTADTWWEAWRQFYFLGP